ncbi:rhomboid family intramembrane serine protease [Ectothiorhodospira variabilis]|uniref:rhomboid family intramembrane serine protease n=1 Tax=Ectothiorhodospira variabilis TaxID=505694 RepID=UPI001EFAB9E5|nr:rhomboid family intramembrane serine protease [Ectothiorhodospira variabilis]MCG5494522.1 rhomboid family intramembrane serine protease [Ectothiorhodospira variabilis]MCG5503107.1 rhomboid family intramembrane serine protease [Ectothiorhodospira variabilis]MCG5506134.1 rhomboid family intramembrane serine protease [Ectothiorhodospira variabilis]
MIPINDENPTERPPLITWTLLIGCVLVFFWQLTLDSQALLHLVYGLGFVPAVLLQGARLPEDVQVVAPWMTVFTSQFLHGGWLHLISNMLFLYVFANNVEDAMGHGRFLVFYLLGGAVAALGHGLFAPGSEVPMIGASGAISAVLGAYLLLHPSSRITVLIPLGLILYPARLPAAAVLVLWFVIQLFQALLTPPDQPGVAFLAHVAGFAAGVALLFVFKRRDVRLLQ